MLPFTAPIDARNTIAAAIDELSPPARVDLANLLLTPAAVAGDNLAHDLAVQMVLNSGLGKLIAATWLGMPDAPGIR